ncbi:MAG: Uma2 family endonuclease [Lachnospiraceae bacterium]|nr:Uma2 family endonuclease [Lachnospiraceae bacterium]
MTIDEMNEIKRKLGYTDIRIAEISGVPLSTVRKVLGGITKTPRFETLKALSDALEKSAQVPAGQDGTVTVRTAESEAPKAFSYSDSPASPIQTVREAMPAYKVKKQGEYTLEDYLAIPDERRVELIDGVIYDMSSPLGHHQIIAGQIYADLLAFISRQGGPCIPFIAPVDVQLDCDNKTIVQPDVLILCDRDKYTPQRIVGAPDFVVEVLSKSTRKKDMFIKLNKYKFAGVREYWLVDPDSKTILVYLFEQGDEIHFYSFRDKVPVGIYEGRCVIDFAPMDDFVSQLPH